MIKSSANEIMNTPGHVKSDAKRALLLPPLRTFARSRRSRSCATMFSSYGHTMLRRAAFQTNNFGANCLRHGNSSHALEAFREATELLKQSTHEVAVGSHLKACHELVSPPPPPLFLTKQSSSSGVQVVESNEMDAALGYQDLDSTFYVVAIRDLPIDSHEITDFQVASLLYNYGLAHLFCFLHRKHEPRSDRNHYLQAAKKLFVFARDIAFRDIAMSASSQLDAASAPTPTLHLANFVLSGLDLVCRIRQERRSMRRNMEAKEIIEEHLNQALILGDIFQKETAGAA